MNPRSVPTESSQENVSSASKSVCPVFFQKMTPRSPLTVTEPSAAVCAAPLTVSYDVSETAPVSVTSASKKVISARPETTSAFIVCTPPAASISPSGTRTHR